MPPLLLLIAFAVGGNKLATLPFSSRKTARCN